MLVLSRKSSESIVIGSIDGVEHVLKVTVLEIRRKMVKLGFEAAKGVSIRRSEVWQRIRTRVPKEPQTPDQTALLSR